MNILLYHNILLQKIHIIDCGELKYDKNWGMEENDDTEDVFTPWPEDWDYSKDIERLNVRILLG